MVIIDTSVTFKWFFEEQESQVTQARKLLELHLNKKESLHAPDLMLYELTNALITKTELPLPKIKSFIQDLDDLKIKFETVTFDLMIKAAHIAKKYTISVYDSTYVALAEKNNCDLVTADTKLQRKLNLTYVKTLDQLALG